MKPLRIREIVTSGLCHYCWRFVRSRGIWQSFVIGRRGQRRPILRGKHAPACHACEWRLVEKYFVVEQTDDN